MNKNLDEYNGRGGNQENGLFRKLQRLSRKTFWKNIGYLLSAPTFGLGVLRLWDKYPKINCKKTKRSSIISKVGLYEVCAYLFQILYYCYYFYTNTYFPSARFVASLTLGERSLGNICQEALIRRKKSRKMSSEW